MVSRDERGEGEMGHPVYGVGGLVTRAMSGKKGVLVGMGVG